MKYGLVLGGGFFFVLGGLLTMAQNLPPQQSSPKPPPSTTGPAPAITVTGVGQPVDPNKYLIGAEDVLHVQVWREPDLTVTAAVRPDGKITMPLIGEVQAAGITPIQLTKELTDKLGQYVNRPDVTITVLDVRSKKYYIDGGVNRPGEYALVTPTRVFDALSKAGGFLEFANPKKIRIIRNNGAAPQTFKFNWKQVSQGKHMEQNIFLENGDHIYVPQ